MARMSDDDINKIIKNHEHWLHEDCDGWKDLKANLESADLYGADLRLVNLSWVNLRKANLNCADLSGADLIGADLAYAHLIAANLREANLRGANLSGVDLKDADLCVADLAGADLCGADLRDTDIAYADLRGANLNCANLSGADLNLTNLDGANLSHTNLEASKGPLMEYRKGKVLTEDIIGYKKCKYDVIVTLKIPRGAIVFSINGCKCRTNKVKVIDIDGSDRAISNYKYMSYYVGDEITVYNFNCEYNIESAEGIHFYMTREDAENHY